MPKLKVTEERMKLYQMQVVNHLVRVFKSTSEHVGSKSISRETLGLAIDKYLKELNEGAAEVPEFTGNAFSRGAAEFLLAELEKQGIEI